MCRNDLLSLVEQPPVVKTIQSYKCLNSLIGIIVYNLPPQWAILSPRLNGHQFKTHQKATLILMSGWKCWLESHWTTTKEMFSVYLTSSFSFPCLHHAPLIIANASSPGCQSSGVAPEMSNQVSEVARATSVTPVAPSLYLSVCTWMHSFTCCSLQCFRARSHFLLCPCIHAAPHHVTPHKGTICFSRHIYDVCTTCDSRLSFWVFGML